MHFTTGAFEPLFYSAKPCKYTQKYTFVTGLRQENALAFHQDKDIDLQHEIGDGIDEMQFQINPKLYIQNPCDYGLDFYGVEDSLTGKRNINLIVT